MTQDLHYGHGHVIRVSQFGKIEANAWQIGAVAISSRKLCAKSTSHRFRDGLPLESVDGCAAAQHENQEAAGKLTPTGLREARDQPRVQRAHDG